MTATTEHPPALRCPRCGAEVGPGQDWCVECGLAARTRLVTAPSWRVPLVAAATLGAAALIALVIAFVALSGDNGPVTTTTRAKAAPSAAAQQLTRMRSCLGRQATPVPVFAPTVTLAESQGGGAATARFGRQKVELIVFPTAAAAQIGFQNAQDQLVALQQQQPAAFTALAPRQQVIGNVLEIIMRGALSPTASARVGGCINPAA